jgi:hypothetical protein
VTVNPFYGRSPFVSSCYCCTEEETVQTPLRRCGDHPPPTNNDDVSPGVILDRHPSAAEPQSRSAVAARCIRTQEAGTPCSGSPEQNGYCDRYDNNHDHNAYR